MEPTSAVLVTGAVGTGKTTFLKAIACQYVRKNRDIQFAILTDLEHANRLTWESVSCNVHFFQKLETVREFVQSQSSSEHHPTVIIIDDFSGMPNVFGLEEMTLLRRHQRLGFLISAQECPQMSSSMRATWDLVLAFQQTHDLQRNYGSVPLLYRQFFVDIFPSFEEFYDTFKQCTSKAHQALTWERTDSSARAYPAFAYTQKATSPPTKTLWSHLTQKEASPPTRTPERPQSPLERDSHSLAAI